MTNTSVNPLAQLEPDQRPQWFRLHSEAQAHEALRQWVQTASLTDMLHPAVPETHQVFLCDLLLGNPQKRVQRIRRNFSLEVLEEIKVGRGLNEYGQRVYDVYEAGEYQMSSDEAIQIFLKYGPNGRGQRAGKVRETPPAPRAVKKTKKKADA